MTRLHRALIAVPDARLARALERALAALGHEAKRATCVAEAEAALDERPFCYALLAAQLPARKGTPPRVADGLALLHRIRRAYPAASFAVLALVPTGDLSRTSGRLIRAGCTGLLATPLEQDPDSLERALGEAGLVCENRRPQCLEAPIPPTGAARAYQVERSFHFVGECRRRRYLLFVDEVEVYLPRWLFEPLFRLAVFQQRAPGAYVPRQKTLGTSADKVVSELRRLLAAQADLERGVVEPDDYGGVRLSVPPDRVTFATDALAADFDHLLHLLDADARKRA
jgi:ActR/RegA family two-component response regulator